MPHGAELQWDGMAQKFNKAMTWFKPGFWSPPWDCWLEFTEWDSETG